MKQTIAITLINLRAISSRVGSTLIMIIGVTSIVVVLTSMLALATGLENTFVDTGRPDRVVILSENAHFVGQSTLSKEHVYAVEQAPGIAMTPDGKPAVTHDSRISLILKGKEDGVLKGVVVRGLSPAGLDVRSEVRLVEGRMYQTGLYEAIVGRQAQSQFENTAIGDRVRLESTYMEVVGVFESGDWLESGFITDSETLLGAYGRTATNAVIATLEQEDTLSELESALADHASLKFQVLREPVYYDRLTEAFSLLDRLVKFVGAIIAVGGVFCVVNVMYSAVSSRDVEIATYRALGFGNTGVVVSVVTESVLIALAAAGVGVSITWLLFNGNTVTTGSFDASVVHKVRVSADVMLTGLGFAVGVAFLGSVAPAVQAVRTPITAVQRSL